MRRGEDHDCTHASDESCAAGPVCTGGLWAAQFSFRLKRYCKTASLAETASFNGISFPGSQIGSTTYFSLTPSYDALPATPAYRYPPTARRCHEEA